MSTDFPAPEPALLTTDELAARLQVPTKTIRSWRRRGYGPRGIRVGRHVRYTPGAVSDWLATQAAEAREETP